jgi:PAS domain S-box-containing protein
MRWGTHFCLFYETPADLLGVLVPFFKAGLEAGELCLWIVSEPVSERTVVAALREELPDVDAYLAAGALVILPHDAWYLVDGRFDRERAVLKAREVVAAAGSGTYQGLRAHGLGSWLAAHDEETHREFVQYETELNDVLRGKRVIAACAMRISDSRPSDIFDIARAHEFVLARRHGEWQLLESPELARTREAVVRLNQDLESRVHERTRELSAQKEILQQIFDHIPVMIGLFDPSGRLTFVNQEWERVRGWTVRELLADADAILQRIYPDPFDYSRMRAHLAAASGEWMDFRTRTKDGRVIETQWAAIAMSEGGRLAIGQDITARKRVEDELRQSSEQLRAMAASASSAREQEAVRIARELHDELGSTLTSLKWDLESLRDALSRPTPTADNLAERVDGAIRLAEQILASIRKIASSLRPPILDDLGLVEAIEWQAQRVQARTGIVCALQVEGDVVPLPSDRATAMFRIFQEALTNVLRHAQATRVDIRLTFRGHELQLAIQDDGRGITEDARSNRQSLGLLGMHERARAIGGTLEISGDEGRGTQVTVRIPL